MAEVSTALSPGTIWASETCRPPVGKGIVASDSGWLALPAGIAGPRACPPQDARAIKAAVRSIAALLFILHLSFLCSVRRLPHR